MENKLSFDDKSIILSLCLSIMICISNFFQFYQIVSISFRLLFVVTVIMFVHRLLRNKAVSNMVLMIIFTSILAFVFVWWNCKTSISIGYLSKYLSFVSTLLFFYLATYTQETSSKLLNIIMILYCLLSAFYFYAYFLCSNDSLKYYTTIYYSSTFRYLFFISWFTEASTKYWYILAIAVFYLAFPLIYKYIHVGSNGLIKTIVFCICWWVGIEVFCFYVPEVNKFRIALERLPIFVFGIYCGKLSYDKAKINKKLVPLIAVWGYCLFIFLKAPISKPFAETLYYPMRAFLSLSIIITIILILECCESKMKSFYGVLLTILGWFGSVTLELYLFHQSYMILFNFPYRALYYCIVAFGLPTVTATLITIYRKKKVRT